jgi:AcrR family transcriptional regulator
MPKISQAQRDARRQQILDAAVRCFSRDGFHNTTTADLVRESGVSQGTLYLYFATKDDIILALADDRHHGQAFLNALAQNEPDPVQGLMLLIELYGKGLADKQRADLSRVGVQGWAEALRNPTIRASILEGISAVQSAIVDLVRRGQAGGQIRPEADPEAVARTLTAIFQGFLLQTAWGETFDLEACGRLIRDMIHGALLAPPTRQPKA